MSGSVAVDDIEKPNGSVLPRIRLEPVYDSRTTALGVTAVPISKNQTFTFDDVPLGRFRVSVVPASSNSEWTIESVIMNEHESVDTGFEVTGEPISGVAIRITNQPARIRGMLSDGKDQPVADYRVTVFSTDSSRWSFPSRYVGSARTGRDGRYVIENVAPGDYFVVAQQDVALDDVAMLEMFTEASRTAASYFAVKK